MDAVKIGCIMQSYADAETNKKYTLYTTKSLEALEDVKEIGKARTYEEACKILNNYLASIGREKPHYWRMILNTDGTFIDYGSWVDFLAIVPAVPMEVLRGDVKEF